MQKLNYQPGVFEQALTLARSKYSQRSDNSAPSQQVLPMGPVLKHYNSSVDRADRIDMEKEVSVSDYLVNSQ